MICGIDLGTSHSLIGVMDAGFPLLLAGEDGSRLTPSAVYYPAAGDPLVGLPAYRMHTVEPGNTLLSTKRFIGLRHGESEQDEASLSVPLASAVGEPICFSTAAGAVSPTDVAARILLKLKADAERALEAELLEAVISVPAYFNDGQRKATIAAGEQAGFIVRSIINEPTAAALAAGFDGRSRQRRIAVYDLGGGTFDISILELQDQLFEVLSTCGNTRLGGNDIDRAIVDWLLYEAGLARTQLDVTQLAALEAAAVNAKHALTTSQSTTIELPFVAGKNISIKLDRNQLEALAMPVLRATRAHCLQALEDAKITAAELDAVLLVGGVTRMPCVSELVADIFYQQPQASDNPDEAVALGATLRAGMLSGAVSGLTLLDVTPLSLGIETFGGLMNVIIPRNTTLPTKAGELFTNAVSGQSAMSINVLQGEREMARDNWPLGKLEIPFAAVAKGQARVGVQFSIDSNGLLQVLARDTISGTEQILELDNAVDLEDQKVEAMIAQSVDHAFEDMSQRLLTEARLKAKEMLPAVDQALAKVGDQVDDTELKKIRQCRQRLQDALEDDNLTELKNASHALDEATQSLATAIVERAMEEALRRKGAL